MPALMIVVLSAVATVLGLVLTGELTGTGSVGGGSVPFGIATGVIKSGLYLALTLSFGYGFVLTLLQPGAGRQRPGQKQVLTAEQQSLRGGALTWSLATVILLIGSTLLRYVDAAGTDFSRLDYFLGTQVGEISLIAIVLAAIGALFFALRGGLAPAAWGMGFMTASIIALGFLGHAGASIDHANAVNAMVVHLLGVVLWLGPLLVILLGARNRDAQTTRILLLRYSPWAVFAIVSLAFSGLVNGMIRLQSLVDLVGTEYGLLVLAKTIGLVVIASAGWMQRRLLLGSGVRSGALDFRRIALGELGIAAAVIGLSIALGRSQPPVNQFVARSDFRVLSLVGYEAPSKPFSVLTLFTEWRWDWMALGFSVLMAALYLMGVARLRRRGDDWVWHRTVFWLAGCLLFVWVMSGGPGVYGRVRFDAHMVQHMALMIIVPPLWVLGAPVTLLSRAVAPRSDGSRGMREWVLAILHSGYGRLLSRPPVAGAIFAGSLVAFYFTPVFTWAMFAHAGHLFMTVHFLLSGYLFAWVIIGVDPSPHPVNPILKLVTLLATLSFHAFFGLAVVSATWIIGGPWYQTLGMFPVEELAFMQKQGGSIMWGVSEVPTLLYAIVMTWQWTQSEDRVARQYDRKARRDNDAELEAYNQYLKSLGSE